MSDPKPDDCPVTWGELREAIDLAVSFSAELAGAASFSAGRFEKRAQHLMSQAEATASRLNDFMGKKIIVGLGDE